MRPDEEDLVLRHIRLSEEIPDSRLFLLRVKLPLHLCVLKVRQLVYRGDLTPFRFDVGNRLDKLFAGIGVGKGRAIDRFVLAHHIGRCKEPMLKCVTVRCVPHYVVERVLHHLGSREDAKSIRVRTESSSGSLHHVSLCRKRRVDLIADYLRQFLVPIVEI